MRVSFDGSENPLTFLLMYFPHKRNPYSKRTYKSTWSDTSAQWRPKTLLPYLGPLQTHGARRWRIPLPRQPPPKNKFQAILQFLWGQFNPPQLGFNRRSLHPRRQTFTTF